MRKVFLDDLPKKKGFGQNSNKLVIDWQNSVGYKIRFTYDDVDGLIEILDYYHKNNQRYLDVKYENTIVSIYCNNLLKCKLGSLIGKQINGRYKYEVGEVINTKQGAIQIVEQKIIKYQNYNWRGYSYKCLIDGNIDDIYENQLKNGIGCNVCSNTKVLKGYNDLWTTHPNLAQLLKHPQKGYEVSYGSGFSEIFVCPNCFFEKDYKIYNISKYGFSCPRCGDNISYPEKFVVNLLEQLGVEYQTQLSKTTFKWCNNFKYDFYVNKIKCIIETHGMQHYRDSTGSWCELKQIQENDKNKEDIATSNGILSYIVLDCRRSDIKWIKKSVMNSQLPTLLNFSEKDIDWEKCHEFACGSMIKDICDCWNNDTKNTLEISKIFDLSRTTVWRYLKYGSELGLCDYCADESQRMGRAISGKKTNNLNAGGWNKKATIQLTLDNNFIKKWESAAEAGRELKINSGNIRSCCLGLRKSTSGYKWMYYDDYIEQQNKENIA